MPNVDASTIIKPLRPIAALSTLAALFSCATYFDSSPKPELTNKVKTRLEHAEEFNLPDFSTGNSISLDSAVAEAQRNRRKLTEKFEPSNKKKLTTPQPKDSWPLTIAEARGIALENNLDLRIALIEPSIAQTYVSEEQAKFDDLIFANANYSNKETPPLDSDVVSFSPVNPNSSLATDISKLNLLPQETKQLDLDVGIVVPLRTGGKIILNSPFSKKETDRFVSSDQYLSALRFSMSQPLLRDAGVSTNVAGIRIARYERDIADLKTRLQTIRVLATVDKAYWALYAAWGQLDVRRQQYKIAIQNLAMVRRRVNEGLVAAIEINRAEIGVAERAEALILAKTKLKLSQRQLTFLLNDERYKLDTTTVIVPNSRPTLVKFDFERDELARKALSGRLELLELELNLAADATKIEYLENQTLPVFMLEYGYGVLGRSTDDFGSAYDESISDRFDDWTVGFKVEIPLTNELRKSRLRRAVKQRIQRLTTRDLRTLTVRREIFDALDQVDQNWQRIVANRQNVVLAGANYDAEQKQFNEGLRTMTEVLETLTKLGEAQLKEVKAISHYQVSLIDLSYATGTLLGYSRVRQPDLMF